MSCILAPSKEMLTLVLAFFYARTGFADADTVSYLTLSLRWLTLTRVLLTPHPYNKGHLPQHEHKGLARGSFES